jgi:ribosome-associated toxin RatA of RatAB toxin-antitoxin module
MRTIDELVVEAPADVCFRTGADVERWPDILAHYRWVRFQRKDGFGTGRVEMAARRDFGPLPYPVWWVSDMRIDESAPAVHYLHVDGITTGMDVIWSFEPLSGEQTLVRILHTWDAGPRWPLPRLLRRLIANLVIGPIFISHVAGRTLQGVRARAEQVHKTSGRVVS